MSKTSYSFTFLIKSDKTYTVISNSGNTAIVPFLNSLDSNGQVPSYKIDLGNNNWFYFSIGEVNYPPPRASYGDNAVDLTLKSNGKPAHDKGSIDSIIMEVDDKEIFKENIEMFREKFVPPTTYWITSLDISFDVETKSNPPNKIISNLKIIANFNTGKHLASTNNIYSDPGNTNMLFFRVNYDPSSSEVNNSHTFNDKIYANHSYPIIITDNVCYPSEISQYDNISHFSSFIFKIK